MFQLIGLHLLASAAVEAAFSWRFGHSPRTIPAHILIVALWDVTILWMLRAITQFAVTGPSRLRRIYPFALALTATVQVYLYTLNIISNVSWGRNMTGHLVVAFAPTVWSGKEPFPVGRTGITLFAIATLLLMVLIVAGAARALVTVPNRGIAGRRGVYGLPTFALAIAAGAAFAGTLMWGVSQRDNLLWKQELIASFFRPEGYAFEPSARREAVAARDAVLQAAYPHRVSGAHRKNVILIIVDSLRADRMQIYGYPRETTPFLAGLVQNGRMKKVDDAFASCSESFCGITSTLASREFRDISARTFQLQDVLRDEGYETWFLLAGNHSAWNGLPSFYHTSDATFFDGSKTERYTMDDDRLVLEGLERVPPATAAHPAFFYLHLMSTHYLGVQFDKSHYFTRPDDQVSPGLEPYKILEKLEKPDRYDDKVRQADTIIAQLFAALAAKHYLDDAVVVITGDHGEGLGERHWAHGWDLHNEDIRIPMLFYDAPPVSYPDLSFAAQVDIAPTILDRLGLPIPESWEGESLLKPTRTRFTYHQTYFVPNRFAVLYRNDNALFKFIATPQYGKEELYDLMRDRGEVRNLVTEQPQLAALLRDKVRRYQEP